MSHSGSRREQKKRETRQALLAASLALFRDKGYSATTVEEITVRADVAKGTFFNYFSSKEALLSELAVWQIERLRAALDVTRGAPASPVARIKLLMRLVHEQAAPDMRLARKAFATRLSHPPPPPQRAKFELVGLLADLVTEGQAQGEIRSDLDVGLVSDLLSVTYFRRMVAFRCDDGEPPPADHVDEVIDLLMGGLAGPNWRRK